MKKFLAFIIILGAVGLIGAHQLFASSISVSDTTLNFSNVTQANAAQGVHYNGFQIANNQGTQEGLVVVDGYTKQNVTANSISFLVNIGSDYTGNLSFNLGVTPDGGTQQSYPLSTMSSKHYSNGGSYDFNVVVSGLDASTKYNFQLTELTTGSSSSVFSETTAASGSSTPGITATTTPTATSFTVDYTYTGTPTQTLSIYSWLTNTATSTWVDRSNLLITIRASSTQVTKTFRATYNFSSLTGNGTKYAYYLYDADGAVNTNANLLYGAANFTVGTAPVITYAFAATGQFAGNSAGTYQEGFTVTPSSAPTTDTVLTLSVAKSSAPSVVVSQNSVTMSAGSTGTVSPGTNDLAPGSYIANLFNGTTSIGTVKFTLTSAVSPFETALASLLTTGTIAAFDVTVTKTQEGSDFLNGHIVLKIGNDANALTTTVVAYDGNISHDGTPFKVETPALDATSPLYYYQFTETTSGTKLASGSFYLNSPSDQAAGPVNPAGNNGCNSKYNGQTLSAGSINDKTTDLCTTGTSSHFFASDMANGPWTWICEQISGKNDICGTKGTGNYNSKTDGKCNLQYNGATPSGPIDANTPSLCVTGAVTKFVATDATNGPWSWTCAAVATGGQSDNCSTKTQTPAVTNPATNFLQNPLSSTLNSFPAIFAAIMNNIVMPIAVIFLPLAFIYSGFLFVIARKKGSTDGIEKAKTTFKWTFIGAVLILGATVIANALQGTVTQIFGK